LNNRHDQCLSAFSVIFFHHENAKMAFIVMMNLTSIAAEQVKTGKTVKKSS